MKGATGYLVFVFCLAALSGSCGCTRIAVAPSCPERVAVGEEVNLLGNVQNPGAIPTYQWEVTPTGAGQFVDPAAPDTGFEGVVEGEAIIRFTASDGLFQVIDECRILVTSSTAVSVSLAVDPSTVVVGDPARLVCISVGEGAEAVTRTIRQTEGANVSLTPASEGVATFTPTEEGELTFECVGQAADGRESPPSVLTVSVAAGADDQPDDDTRPPTRPGRR